LFSHCFGCLRLSRQHAKGDALGKLLETAEIVVDHFLLESLESIGETSFHYVEINRYASDSTNVSDSSSASQWGGFGRLWKTIESSPGRADIARRVEARAEKS